jgi:hypothetical protein
VRMPRRDDCRSRDRASHYSSDRRVGNPRARTSRAGVGCGRACRRGERSPTHPYHLS